MPPPKQVREISTVGAHITIERAAALLDMSSRWLKERVKAGELPAYRLGHKIVIGVDDLKKFLANHAINPSADKGDDGGDDQEAA